MTETSPDPANAPPGTTLDWNDPSTLPVEEVRFVFVVLAKALRAQQLYDQNNPVYQRFVSQLAASLEALWTEMDRLPISVDQGRFTWMGEDVYESDSRADSLAFLFYKDGVREFTIHQGLETHELASFLQALNRARDLRVQGDDLLTILWEKDLKYFTYTYIDVLAEGGDLNLPSGGVSLMGGFEKIIQEEAAEEEAPERQEPAGEPEEEAGFVGAGPVR